MQINHHIGRLVRPVNFRNIDDPNRTNVAYVRLAVDGMTAKQTTFLDYVAFGKTAELLSKLTMDKGDLVELQFNMQNNEYVDQVTQKKVFNSQNVISRIKVYHNG
ncbi:single-stranded DNA-binding protein, partial [Fructobacillus fructosus]|uniref:single-stranded DNA-binding protein n=1 Tax=Fructobacillus fructosus TaxID=1631 RepID=UPI0030C7CDB7